MNWKKNIHRALFRRNEEGWTFSLVVGALFMGVLIAGHLHHEMWRDELHCFAMGRNSPGLWDLLTGERRYDGHPFLWYYVLHLASLVTRSYKVVHVVTTAVAVTAATLWVRYATFPRVLRVLLLGTYYILFEYGVMCRSYSLGILLIFAFCAAYHPCRIRYVPLGLLLALLAMSNFFAFLLSAALALFLFSHGPTIEPSARLDGRRRLALPLDWLLGLGIYVAGVALTVATTLPPEDAIYRKSDLAEVTSAGVRESLAFYWIGMFPARHWLEWIWSGLESIGKHFDVPAQVEPRLAIGWLALWLIAFRRAPRVFVCYAVGVLLMAAGVYFVYNGGQRHLGHYFILTIACLWLYGRETRTRAPQRLIVVLFTIGVLVQVVVGVVAFRAEWNQSYSGSLEAATFIRTHGLQDWPIIANPDEPATPVAVILDRPFFFPITGETTDMTVFHARRRPVSESYLLEQAERLARAARGSALILTNYDLHEKRSGLRVKLLHQGAPAVASDEALKIYEADVKGESHDR
jgi:hypothetical protein